MAKYISFRTYINYNFFPTRLNLAVNVVVCDLIFMNLFSIYSFSSVYFNLDIQEGNLQCSTLPYFAFSFNISNYCSSSFAKLLKNSQNKKSIVNVSLIYSHYINFIFFSGIPLLDIVQYYVILVQVTVWHICVVEKNNV